jgi:hypothetical protein
MKPRDFVQTQNEEKVIRSCYLHWFPPILKAKHLNPRS